MQGCENAYNFSLSATVIFGTFHISQLPEEKTPSPSLMGLKSQMELDPPIGVYKFKTLSGAVYSVVYFMLTLMSYSFFEKLYVLLRFLFVILAEKIKKLWA